MASLADKAILSGADNRPPMLEKDMYDSWKSRMELYMLNRQHGRMILESVEQAPTKKNFIFFIWIFAGQCVRLKVPVQRIQTDNGTEFVNQTLRDYYEEVGISHETSVGRSSQQNRVVERRNRTLIEAARTISGLVPKPSSSTSYVPPTRNGWDLLFQPLFDELLNPPPSVDSQDAEV
nr:retrotransposon protein, putative, Ty1-copia subclass [Tanacetum cinerariifolium]